MRRSQGGKPSASQESDRTVPDKGRREDQRTQGQSLGEAALPCRRMQASPTPHRLSFQGRAADASQQPVLTGDVAVRHDDEAIGGALADSGSEFTGAIARSCLVS